MPADTLTDPRVMELSLPRLTSEQGRFLKEVGTAGISKIGAAVFEYIAACQARDKNLKKVRDRVEGSIAELGESALTYLRGRLDDVETQFGL